VQSETPRRIHNFLKNPPRWLDVVLWILLLLSAFGIRAYFIHKLPVALWSKDGGSYTYSAFRWLHEGIWETDPRRGAVYSLFIAGCVKLGGSLSAIMVVQHLLGGIAIVSAMIALRAMYPSRAALVPVALCSYAYAMYGLPLYLEHLIRNETLLFFFGSLAFASWLLAIKRDEPHWLWISGFSASLLMLTKSVFGPFPVVLMAGHAWFYRKTPKLAALQIAIFLVAFALPILCDKFFKAKTMHRPPEPQAGILLYGRTAQFTYLDGGILPDIKREIRSQVEDYRKEVFADPKHPRLNNNEVLKITIVPHIREIVSAQNKLPADAERVCKQLAFEAIKTHPKEYAVQVLRDLETLEMHTGSSVGSPKSSDLTSVATTLKQYKNPDPLMKVDETTVALNARVTRKYFSLLHHFTRSAWLFRLKPVLLVTLLLPVFVFGVRDKMRLWWLGAAAIFYFTLVLLCTVGRPLDRYMIPAVPVMFWTLAAAFVWLWKWTMNFIAKKYSLD
jgi:hypothetical protein